jgi:asparagine synthase (glutamine-hydrolysing)
MCGIAGGLALRGATISADAVEQMIRQLGHRGPDDMSLLVDGDAILAHSRLSIVDVANGLQPMSAANGRFWITFNGEIFNYLELREDLIRRGHTFATRSDTEVLLHLYQEYGSECVHHLNGQWAFAIWDTDKKHLFLSRDRVGVRPLFYTVHANRFLFASEVKSLLAYPGVPRTIDPQALDQVFTFWTTLSPRTMFKGVSELPPGHSLSVINGQVAVRSYWRPRYDVQENIREDEAASTLLDLLVDATRIRLRADVPVGAYLSGGLDSTVIAALIKGYTATPLRTFSVEFEDSEFDESAYQASARQYLNTDHESVRCSTADIGRIFPKVVWHAEKPVLRTAPAPMFILSKLVRERGYKVVLTGEGADEMLGGYDIFKEVKLRRFLAASPDSRLRPLLLRRLYPYMDNIQSQPAAYLRAFFKTSREDLASPFFSHLPRWSLTAKLKLFYSAELRGQLQGYDPVAEFESALPGDFGSWHPFVQAQYLETAQLLPSYILSSQGDRMSMGNSVEGRFPFLDYRVVEFASSLPPQLKMKVLNEKYLLKRAVAGLVPEAIRRRKKQPYRAPDSASFINPQHELIDYASELLSPRTLRDSGLFNSDAVARLVTKARHGQIAGTKDNMAFVGILSTQLLVDQFIGDFTHEQQAHRNTSVRRRELPVRAER